MSPLPDLTGLSPFQVRRACASMIGTRLPVRPGEVITRAQMVDGNLMISYRRTVVSGSRNREQHTITVRGEIYEPRPHGRGYRLAGTVEPCDESTPVRVECLSAHMPTADERAASDEWTRLGRPFGKHGYRVPVTP